MNEEGGRLILVVDDERHITRMVSSVLLHAGFRVSVANGGREALDRLEEGDIDLAVLDVMMPELDGLELTKLVRQRGSLPVILLSALDSRIDRERGLAAGADDYLVKPFRVAELIERVRELVGGSAAGSLAH